MSLRKSDKSFLNIVDEDMSDKTNFFDIKDFSQVIKEMEEIICQNSGGEEEKNINDSIESTAYQSPILKNEELRNFKSDEMILINSLRKFNQSFEIESEDKSEIFVTNLKSEKKSSHPGSPKVFKGKVLKTANFLKKNWKNKLANFKETRKRKLISKINFLQNEKINNFDCNIQEKKCYSPAISSGSGKSAKNRAKMINQFENCQNIIIDKNPKAFDNSYKSLNDMNGSFTNFPISLPGSPKTSNGRLTNFQQNYNFSPINEKKIPSESKFVNKNNVTFLPLTTTYISQSLFNNKGKSNTSNGFKNINYNKCFNNNTQNL